MIYASALRPLRVAVCATGLITGFTMPLAAPAAAQEVDKPLEARMEKEKAERKGCKIAICDAARFKKADGPDIACTVTKTWAATDLKDSILKGKLDWPWGHAQCTADIKIERKMLAQALSTPNMEAKLAKQTVTCTLDQKGGSEKYSISFVLTPTVTFSGGKATKATLNWSDIQGSALAKGAVWSAATLDNNGGRVFSFRRIQRRDEHARHGHQDVAGPQYPRHEAIEHGHARMRQCRGEPRRDKALRGEHGRHRREQRHLARDR